MENSFIEEEAISKGRGKWADPDVPHKGWRCIDIEDLGGPFSECEMCESQEIRYVHYMEHSDYPKQLAVGCICAGHMEENVNQAQARDDFMKKRASKRKRWIEHRSWKKSKNGNDWIKVDGYIIVMKYNNHYWSALIKSEDGNFKEWSRKKYNTIDQAKLSAFDYLTKILAEGR